MPGRCSSTASSLSQNDDHIFEHIEDPVSQIPALYVGLYGKAHEHDNPDVIARAKEIQKRRTKAGNPLALHLYRAKSAKVWR